MSYVVIHDFSDVLEDYHVYHVGDEFPRHGVHMSESRIEALASDNNAVHKPVIAVKEEPKPEPEQEVVKETETQKTEQAKRTKKQK